MYTELRSLRTAITAAILADEKGNSGADGYDSTSLRKAKRARLEDEEKKTKTTNSRTRIKKDNSAVASGETPEARAARLLAESGGLAAPDTSVPRQYKSVRGTIAAATAAASKKAKSDGQEPDIGDGGANSAESDGSGGASSTSGSAATAAAAGRKRVARKGLYSGFVREDGSTLIADADKGEGDGDGAAAAAPAETVSVFVGGLIEFIPTHELEELFGAFGDLVDVRNPKNKPLAFVNFASRAAALAAVKALHGTKFRSNYLRVDMAIRHEEKQTTVGGVGGATATAGGEGGIEAEIGRKIVTYEDFMFT